MKKLTEHVSTPDDRLDLTPLIDVIFMLLLFFVITTTFAEDTFFPIELATASNNDTIVIRDQRDTAMIELSRDGDLALNKEFLPSAMALYTRLEVLRDSGKLKGVVIKADAGSTVSALVQIMDILRELEIESVAVSTKAQEK